MFIHDSIKLMYTDMGYLPGYPYYLISDSEMFTAFSKEDGFFNSYYPCPGNDLLEAYTTLRNYIVDTIGQYQSGEIESLPNWIYSYMLGSSIAYQSDELDLYYLNDMLGINTSIGLPEFNEITARGCLKVSTAWLQKQPTRINRRPPTMFGEPHVIKSLRLDKANILLNMEGS